MKTILKFTDTSYKQMLICRHNADIKILQETRKAYTKIRDANNNLIEYVDYIVIQIPKKYNFDLTKMKLRGSDKISTGYRLIDCDHYWELIFFNNVFFTWIVYELEKLGIFKVTRIELPSKEDGVLVPSYINTRGMWQIFYNIIATIINLCYEFYVFKIKNK